MTRLPRRTEKPDPATDRLSFSTLMSSTAGVYGLVVVAGMIVVSRNLDGDGAQALLTVVLTLLVFFAAHVYSDTVAQLSESDSTFAAALAHGVRASLGLFVVGAVPVAFLLLGVVGVLGQADAVWLALTVDMILLGVIGWYIAAARDPRFAVRLGGAVVTAALGAIMIALKALIHH